MRLIHQNFQFLPPHPQRLNHFLDQLGIGFFDLFFIEEWIEGICHLNFIVFVALTLGQLTFSELFFRSLAVVIDIVAEFIFTDIPNLTKVLDMLLDDRFNHLVKDISDGLTSVAVWICLYFLPKLGDDLGKVWIGLLQTLDIGIHCFSVLSTETLFLTLLLLDQALDQSQYIGIVNLIDLDRLQFVVDIQWLPIFITIF